jgi:hypothetical protein
MVFSSNITGGGSLIRGARFLYALPFAASLGASFQRYRKPYARGGPETRRLGHHYSQGVCATTVADDPAAARDERQPSRIG